MYAEIETEQIPYIQLNQTKLRYEECMMQFLIMVLSIPMKW